MAVQAPQSSTTGPTPESIAAARAAQLRDRNAALMSLPFDQRRLLLDAFLANQPNAAREGASR